MIKISVVVPMYNAEKYISECIDSIVNQTMKNEEYEIIIVNNGSTDNSSCIVEKYIENYSNIRIINQENRGMCGSINTGWRAAKGKYISTVHADDFIEHELLEICWKTCEEKELQVLHFGSRVICTYEKGFKNNMDKKNGEENLYNEISPNKVMTGKEMFKQWYWGGPEHLYFFNRKFLIENNLFYDETLFIGDVDFTPRLFMKAQRIMHINKVLYVYRVSELNTSQKIFKEMKYYNTMQISLYKLCDLINEYRDDSDFKLMKNFKLYFLGDFIHMKNWLNTIPGINKKFFISSLYNNSIKKYIEVFGDKCIFSDEYYVFKELKDFYYKIVDKNDIFYELNSKVYNYIEKAIKYKFNKVKKIPFKNENMKIAIYGVGNHTDNMIKYYINTIGNIKAKIYYIDSYKGKKGETYNGEKIINIDNINEYIFDYIVISSASYEKEIYFNLQKKLKNKTSIFRFYEKDDSNLFR